MVVQAAPETPEARRARLLLKAKEWIASNPERAQTLRYEMALKRAGTSVRPAGSPFPAGEVFGESLLGVAPGRFAASSRVQKPGIVGGFRRVKQHVGITPTIQEIEASPDPNVAAILKSVRTAQKATQRISEVTHGPGAKPEAYDAKMTQLASEKEAAAKAATIEGLKRKLAGGERPAYSSDYDQGYATTAAAEARAAAEKEAVPGIHRPPMNDDDVAGTVWSILQAAEAGELEKWKAENRWLSIPAEVAGGLSGFLGVSGLVKTGGKKLVTTLGAKTLASKIPQSLKTAAHIGAVETALQAGRIATNSQEGVDVGGGLLNVASFTLASKIGAKVVQSVFASEIAKRTGAAATRTEIQAAMSRLPEADLRLIGIAEAAKRKAQVLGGAANLGALEGMSYVRELLHEAAGGAEAESIGWKAYRGALNGLMGALGHRMLPGLDVQPLKAAPASGSETAKIKVFSTKERPPRAPGGTQTDAPAQEIIRWADELQASILRASTQAQLPEPRRLQLGAGEAVRAEPAPRPPPMAPPGEVALPRARPPAAQPALDRPGLPGPQAPAAVPPGPPRAPVTPPAVAPNAPITPQLSLQERLAAANKRADALVHDPATRRAARRKLDAESAKGIQDALGAPPVKRPPEADPYENTERWLRAMRKPKRGTAGMVYTGRSLAESQADNAAISRHVNRTVTAGLDKIEDVVSKLGGALGALRGQRDEAAASWRRTWRGAFRDSRLPGVGPIKDATEKLYADVKEIGRTTGLNYRNVLAETEAPGLLDELVFRRLEGLPITESRPTMRGHRKVHLEDLFKDKPGLVDRALAAGVEVMKASDRRGEALAKEGVLPWAKYKITETGVNGEKQTRTLVFFEGDPVPADIARRGELTGGVSFWRGKRLRHAYAAALREELTERGIPAPLTDDIGVSHVKRGQSTWGKARELSNLEFAAGGGRMSVLPTIEEVSEQVGAATQAANHRMFLKAYGKDFARIETDMPTGIEANVSERIGELGANLRANKEKQKQLLKRYRPPSTKEDRANNRAIAEDLMTLGRERSDMIAERDAAANSHKWVELKGSEWDFLRRQVLRDYAKEEAGKRGPPVSGEPTGVPWGIDYGRYVDPLATPEVRKRAPKVFMRRDFWNETMGNRRSLSAAVRAGVILMQSLKSARIAGNPSRIPFDVWSNLNAAEDGMGVSPFFSKEGLKVSNDAFVGASKFLMGGQRPNDPLFDKFESLGGIRQSALHEVLGRDGFDKANADFARARELRGEGRDVDAFFHKVAAVTNYVNAAYRKIPGFGRLVQAYPISDQAVAFAVFKMLVTGKGSVNPPMSPELAWEKMQPYFDMNGVWSIFKAGLLGRNSPFVPSYMSYPIKVGQHTVLNVGSAPPMIWRMRVPLLTGIRGRLADVAEGRPGSKQAHAATVANMTLSLGSWFGKKALKWWMLGKIATAALGIDDENEDYQLLVERLARGNPLTAMFILPIARREDGDLEFVDFSQTEPISGLVNFFEGMQSQGTGNRLSDLVTWWIRKNTASGPIFNAATGEDYQGADLGADGVAWEVTRAALPGMIVNNIEQVARALGGNETVGVPEILVQDLTGLRIRRGDYGSLPNYVVRKLTEEGRVQRIAVPVATDRSDIGAAFWLYLNRNPTDADRIFKKQKKLIDAYLQFSD